MLADSLRGLYADRSEARLSAVRTKVPPMNPMVTNRMARTRVRSSTPTARITSNATERCSDSS
ncbi:hypothetical protein HMPREF9336_04308 [Segniliparus rugosus ATCC BAA-974]|uniref:Uncharacterized protein n=1 Tax=Segniliparus rugosus (strain ATCC BAA-974 / DSM 45345 / CCUG 50838 / CIP 108380 / JCM 13579 / CDC 945) TaxID=679197 RepID=U1N4N9_SEGRC|nr:hypothetical protein HMPREF9336_04308 [Segniliparus rugosus ATCC BAA-974]